ncbi:hypothetical protein D3C86_2227340 [compost metagenome]
MAQQIHFRYLQVIQQGQHIISHPIDAVCTERSIRCAMAAQIGSNYPVAAA